MKRIYPITSLLVLASIIYSADSSYARTTQLKCPQINSFPQKMRDEEQDMYWESSLDEDGDIDITLMINKPTYIKVKRKRSVREKKIHVGRFIADYALNFPSVSYIRQFTNQVHFNSAGLLPHGTPFCRYKVKLKFKKPNGRWQLKTTYINVHLDETKSFSDKYSLKNCTVTDDKPSELSCKLERKH